MILLNSLIITEQIRWFQLVQKQIQRAQTLRQLEMVKWICLTDPKLASSTKEEKKSIVPPTNKIHLHV